MIVMKFGGSSVADAERLRRVGDIVVERLPQKPALVLSAMGDTTDDLLAAAETALETGEVSTARVRALHLGAAGALELPAGARDEITPLLDELERLLMGIALIRELTEKTRDFLVSFGERLSVRIAAGYFNTRGIQARALDAWDAGLVSNSRHGGAAILEESWSRVPAAVMPLIDSGVLPVVTGFIAKDKAGNITTLGRGGSDLSATFIAAACGAEEAQVWKDVDGILTADPRLVKEARPVDAVTYEEAAELAYFGAQVLHPRAMLPCMKTGTPVLVKNSYNPEAKGTRIVSVLTGKTAPIQAITSRKNVTLVDIVSTHMLGQYGFLEEVFALFAKHGISVDMVATSEVSVSVTLDGASDLSALLEDLGRVAEVKVKTGKAIVTIVGDVRRSSEILARAFRTCELLGITVQMVSQGASKVNISFIVDDTEAAEVVKALHGDFF
ncbi:MAG: aspartate kinase [Treponematales bacterium]